MNARWWKAPETAFLDRRLQKLPANLFRLWFNLNCVASWSGGRMPALDDAAFLLRMSPTALARRLGALAEAGLLFYQGDEIALVTADAGAPEGQDAGQDRPAPMSAAERQRLFRERQKERQAAEGVTEPVTDVTPTVTTVTALESEQTKKETNTAREARDERDAIFEKFWSVFPSRDGGNPKQPALSEWRKAIVAGANPDELIAAARRYADATRDHERRFICSAVRWLSEGRWQDGKATAPAIDSGVWIAQGSPEWAAWEAHWRATQGKTPPIDNKGGWRFPTKAPPVDDDPKIMTANGHPWPRSRVEEMVAEWKENPRSWPSGWWPPDHWDCMFPRWLLEELDVKMVSTLEAAE